MIPNKEEMMLAIDEAEWDILRAHLERGGLILVDDVLDLAETAITVASDDVGTILPLVEKGMIGKPSADQIRVWDENRKEKKFAMLIVSPYVLIQEKRPTFH